MKKKIKWTGWIIKQRGYQTARVVYRRKKDADNMNYHLFRSAGKVVKVEMQVQEIGGLLK